VQAVIVTSLAAVDPDAEQPVSAPATNAEVPISRIRDLIYFPLA